MNSTCQHNGNTYFLSTEISLHLAQFIPINATSAVDVITSRHRNNLCLGITFTKTTNASAKLTYYTSTVHSNSFTTFSFCTSFQTNGPHIVRWPLAAVAG